MEKVIKLQILIAAIFAAVFTCSAADSYGRFWYEVQDTTFLCKINEDGVTASLIRLDPHPQYIAPAGGHVVCLGGIVIDSKTGWRYTLTDLGDGESSIYITYDVNLIAKKGISRINDYAFDYEDDDFGSALRGAPLNFKVQPGCRLSYIGKNSFPKRSNRYNKLWLRLESDCQIENCRGTICGLTIGDVTLTGDGVSMFEYCAKDSLIYCLSKNPPRIDTPLFEKARSYNDGILIIPAGSKEQYKSHPEWGKFQRIYTKEEYDETFGFEIGENEFRVKNERGDIMSIYRINDDSESVTIVDVLSRHKLNDNIIDCAQPVVNPLTGKSYRLTGIGDGENELKYTTFNNIFDSPVTHIYDYSMQLYKLPKGNHLKYIGKNVFAFDNYVKEMYISDDCTFTGACGTSYVRIGEGVELRGSNSFVWDCYSNDRTLGDKRVIKCMSNTPPKLSINPGNGNSRIVLYVPVGSIEAYRNHEFWGKIENIFESDTPAQDIPTPEPMNGSRKLFEVERKHALGSSILVFGVNADGKTVSLLSIKNSPCCDMSDLQLELPVTDPSTGISYPITAIGNGRSWLGYPVKSGFRVPPTIRQLNSKCFSNMDMMVTVGEDNNLELIEPCIVTDNHLDTLVIKSNCKVTKIGLRPRYTKIYPRETLGEELGNIPIHFSKPVFDPDSSIYDFSNDENIFATIECVSIQPPMVKKLFKQKTWYGTTTLIVPKGCYEAYRAAPEWGDIQNIIESENAAITEPEVDAEKQLEVIVNANGIIIHAPAGSLVTVTDLMGRRVATARVNDEAVTQALAPGIYIVNCPGSNSRKVLVR